MTTTRPLTSHRILSYPIECPCRSYHLQHVGQQPARAVARLGDVRDAHGQVNDMTTTHTTLPESSSNPTLPTYL